ncbi:MAG: AfsR/SARP family transcriptional regulator, partial [Thermocrispum sp.]
MGQAQLDVGVLGVLEVRRDGERLPVAGGRPRAVLAALLASANRPVTVDRLIEAAWGDDLPETPRAALQTVLSRLRATLADAVVVRHGPAGYVLEIAAEALDADRFEHGCARAAAAADRDALAELDAALALWRGPAYVEFRDRDFALAEAARLDGLRLAAIEDRAELASALGDAEAAVAGLEPLVAEHPLRERARGLLMTALYTA